MLVGLGVILSEGGLLSHMQVEDIQWGSLIDTRTH